MKLYTQSEADNITKSILKDRDYEGIYFNTASLVKGKIQTIREFYMKKVSNPNKYNLTVFNDSEDQGYKLKFIEEPLKKRNMATTRKKAATATTKKKRTTATSKVKKTCRKIVGSPEGVKADGTLKKGYKYLKGGRVVKAKAATAKPKKKTTTGRKPKTKK